MELHLSDSSGTGATMIAPVGILQNMVNPSLDPTQPDHADGSELPTVNYGGEGIPRVFSTVFLRILSFFFPIRWSHELNESQKRICPFELDRNWLR